MRSADGPPVHCQPARTRPHLRRQRVCLGIMVVLAAHAVCVFPVVGQNPSDNQSNVVRGTVVNAITHIPIGRALVYSPDNRYAQFTDGEGNFEFTLPKAESEAAGNAPTAGRTERLSWLMARKPGYLEDHNGRSQVEVSVGTDVTIPLEPEALIKGRISLPAADPVRGINVQLLSRDIQDGTPHWMMMNSVVTSSNGEFRFAELRPGTYKVLTREWMDNDPEATVPGGQAYGYPPVYYPSATDLAAASTIQLTAGQIFEADMSLVRQPYYPVKIPVINPDQTGGMNVTVSPQGQHGPGYALGYNRAKDEIDGQLPNGKYLVEGAVYGPNSSASGSVNLVVAGASAEGPTMVLARNNTISLNVKEEFTSNEAPRTASWSDGKHTYAMQGARLDLNVRADPVDDFEQRASASIRQPKRPNDDMVLENIVPGRYWLRLTASRGYVASATMGGTDLLREPLVVVPGANATIDVTMRDDNSELEGTLLGITPPPVDSGRWSPQGFVYCIPLPDSSGQFLELSAGPDGKFDNRMVAPGVYRVIAFGSPQRGLPYHDAEAMKVYETKGQVVHFAPGQKVTLQLQVISGNE